MPDLIINNANFLSTYTEKINTNKEIWISEGDEIEMQIDGLGKISNKIIKSKESAAPTVTKEIKSKTQDFDDDES